MDWSGLILVALGAAIAVYSWRWSVPAQQALLRSVTGREAGPGSWRYRTLICGRWFGTAFGVFVVLGGFSVMLGGG